MKIALSQDKVAIVDAADYDWLNQWKWYARKDPITGAWYAVRNGAVSEGGGVVYMHRAITTAPEGIEIDHRDSDGLNNSRSNIRLATKQQNAFNRGPYKNNASGRKGVSWHARAGKWIAQISVGGQYHYLGLHRDKEVAAKAYADAALRLHGEFARTA